MSADLFEDERVSLGLDEGRKSDIERDRSLGIFVSTFEGHCASCFSVDVLCVAGSAVGATPTELVSALQGLETGVSGRNCTAALGMNSLVDGFNSLFGGGTGPCPLGVRSLQKNPGAAFKGRKTSDNPIRG